VDQVEFEEAGGVVPVQLREGVSAPQEDQLGAVVRAVEPDAEVFTESRAEPDVPKIGAGLEVGRLRLADELGGTYGSG
jgi:hypothetical protein